MTYFDYAKFWSGQILLGSPIILVEGIKKGQTLSNFFFEYPTLTVYYSRSIRSYTNVNKSTPKSAKYICYDNTNGSFSDHKHRFPNISNKIPGLVKNRRIANYALNLSYNQKCLQSI